MTAKCEFEVGILLRRMFERKLRLFLDKQEGLEYTLKEYRGFLTSDYLLTLSGSDELVKAVRAGIKKWVKETT